MKLYEEGGGERQVWARTEGVAVISSFPVGPATAAGKQREVHGERGRERKEIANGEPEYAPLLLMPPRPRPPPAPRTFPFCRRWPGEAAA